MSTSRDATVSPALRRRRQFRLSIVLLGANLVLLNWIALSHFRRIDLTRDKVYTLHPETVRLLKGLDDLLTLRVYLSDELFRDHERFSIIPREVRDWITEFAEAGEGNVRVEYFDPTGDEEITREARAAGVNEAAIGTEQSGARQQIRVFCGVVASYGGREEVIPWAYSMHTELDLALAVNKLTQRETVTIGFGQVRTLPPGIPAREAIRRGAQVDLNDIEHGTFRRLATTLRQSFALEQVPLYREVPPHIDALVLANLERMPSFMWYHIDQYLMDGGTLVILADGTAIDPNTATPVQRSGENDPYLSHYGITVHKDLVLDHQNMGDDFRVVELQPSAFAPDSIMNGISAFPLYLASSISLNPPPDVTATVLARSSPMAWRQQGFFTPLRDQPQAPTRMSEYRAYDLIGMLRGEFTSFYSTHPLPREITEGSPGPTWQDLSDEERDRLRALQDEEDEEDEEDDEVGEGAAGSAADPGGDPAGTGGGDGGPGGASVLQDTEGMRKGFFVKEVAPERATIVVIGNTRFLWDDVLRRDGRGAEFFATLLDRLTTGGRLSAIRHRTTAPPAVRVDLTRAERNAIKYGGMFGMPLLAALFGCLSYALRARRKRSRA